MIDENIPFAQAAVEEINYYREVSGCDYMEAIIWFCNKIDMEPQDLIKKLPESERLRIKADLISGRYVRRKVAKPPKTLPMGE